ncbi:MAG: hypothetical protein KDA96_24965, partial [Planctomycetaceae bacterium]|nr:hypothetical protein [Planctomycetaceae bacterium]
MNRFRIIFILVGLLHCMNLAADEAKVPTGVTELFADFDPRKEPLETRIVREWEKNGIVIRYVTFHIG